jgi:hypothetical protein
VTTTHRRTSRCRPTAAHFVFPRHSAQRGPRRLSLVDYEAVGESSQFSSFSSFVVVFGDFEAAMPPASSGEVVVGRSFRGPRRSTRRPGARRSGRQRERTRLSGLRPSSGGPSHSFDAPRRPFVRPSSGDTGVSLADSPSCGLTRLVPRGRSGGSSTDHGTGAWPVRATASVGGRAASRCRRGAWPSSARAACEPGPR